MGEARATWGFVPSLAVFPIPFMLFGLTVLQDSFRDVLRMGLVAGGLGSVVLFIGALLFVAIARPMGGFGDGWPGRRSGKSASVEAR